MKKRRIIVCFFLGTFAFVNAFVFCPQKAEAIVDINSASVQLQKHEDEILSGQKNPSLGSTASYYNTAFISDIVGRNVGWQNAATGIITGDAGALPALTKAVAYLYNQPASTGVYVADLMRDAGLGITQPAYAQNAGLGFSALNPILETWKVFRNLAYFFYVVIFLVIGFMIMLRKNIGAQTAVTAQQALPRIIISLIAVTFSYAIAGLLIDVMYLLMFLLVSMFQPMFADRVDFHLQNFAINGNIFQLGAAMWSGIQQSGGTGNTAGDAVKAMVTAALKSALGDNVGGNATAGIFGWISGLTFALVFALALVFSIFRLFFELVKTYVSIILAIVLSPLALMLGALPGNNALQSWIKTLVANLIVFPVVLVILLISFMISGTNTSKPSSLVTNEGGGFLPPYLLGQGDANAIRALLGMGMLLIITDLVVQAKKALGGSGGIFEQFGTNFTTALGKGWKGGELVPGLAFTDTSKLPLGGISGQNITRKLAVTGAALGGGGLGLARTALQGRIPETGRRYWRAGFERGIYDVGGEASSLLGEKDIYKEKVAALEANRKKSAEATAAAKAPKQ